MAKKYFNLDDKSLWQKTASYNRLKGKRIPVIENGEKKYIKITKGIKGYLTFVLSKNKNNSNGTEKDTNNTQNKKTEDKNHGSDKQQMKQMEEQQIAYEDQDEYIPQDMEFGESEKEGPYIFQISPPLSGYYNSGKKSYFDKKKLIWSKKKQLQNFNQNIDKSKEKHLFKGRIKDGITAIPLPDGCLPNIDSLVCSGNQNPKFHIDQNNCIYLESNSIQEIAFEFYNNQQINISPPISKDKEKIIKGKLTSSTKSIVSQLKTSSISSREKGEQIKEYIRNNKTYNEKKQGELFKTSKPNNYFYNLDKSESLECYSSNTLLVGLCRELGIESRLIIGHHIDKISKKGTSNIGNNTGHAWTEIWDEENLQWIRLDATPYKKDEDTENNKEEKDGDKEGGNENGEETENGKNDGNESGEGKGDEENKEGNENGEEIEDGKDDGNESGEGDNNNNNNEKGNESGEDGEYTPPSQSPEEALEEMIEQIQEENFDKQKEQLEKEKEDIKNSSSSQKVKDKLNNSNLTEKAKEIIEEKANQKMLDLEKKELKESEEEDKVDDIINNSNIDNPEYQRLLKKYSDLIKKEIIENKKREESKMKNYGFTPEERALYRDYIELENEVKPEIKKNIKALEKILPKEYKIVEEGHFFSGKRLDRRKLVKYAVNKDSRIFTRNREEVKDIIVNMYEIIIIDRSGSMGYIHERKSPIREAIKAAIIRAKTLEYFKVDFSILIFDDSVEEVMEFGEKFTAKKTKIPAKLMKALQKSGGTNISAPLLYAQESMKKYSKKMTKKAVGNITFIGDGQPYGGIVGDELVTLIKKIKKKFPITAFYISNYKQNGDELEKYFGSSESGGTVIIPDVSYLSKGIIKTFNKNIKNILKRIQRKNI